MKNVLELLEKSGLKFPNKNAFVGEECTLTYSEVIAMAKKTGSYLAKELKTKNAPIAVIADKSPKSLAAFFGVAYSGNFYIVIDAEMPEDRINRIFATLNPVCVFSQEKYREKTENLDFGGKILFCEDAYESEIDTDELKKIRDRMIDTDPLYALFTSGSTGIPKGAVICHRSVLAYAHWTVAAFNFDENTIFGNQTPFYFSMSVLDIFSTIMAGSTLCIIPKTCFSFPIKLIEFLNDNRINTIYWVPSALCIVANYKLFSYVRPKYLKKVMFAGEVMPVKQLNYWIKELPELFYANLYGPTEVTDICTYYVVDRKFNDDESLPIGKNCDNCGVLIIKDDNTEASYGEEGELCVRGSFLAMGYYAAPDKTSTAFIQNPVNPYYPEIIYKTGDIVKYNDRGELIYITRKDFQIKHMGYRIELGEIESAVSSVQQVDSCACVFDSTEDNIVCIYQGKKIVEDELAQTINSKLPTYMMPNVYVKVREMPHNRNGKIDRSFLKNNYKNLLNGGK